MRTRSEYRVVLGEVPDVPLPDRFVVHEVRDDDRASLAVLLLDAYRGTIDDEGENEDDAVEAIEWSLSRAVRPHSFVAGDGDALVAMSFVVVVGGRHYIDPVATAASHKRSGLGRSIVAHSLQALAESGVDEAGAVITDGNVASERLFASLGFTRVGAWG